MESSVASGSGSHRAVWCDWELLEEPSDRFLCGVCFQLMEIPQLPTCCGQQYLCTNCIGQLRERAERSARWLEGDNTKKPVCPFCRKEDFQTTTNADLQSSILGLRIRCPHSEEGCAWKGKIQEAQSSHLGLQCKYHPIGCLNNCGATIRRCDVDQHLEVCPNQVVPCPFMPAGCSSQCIRRKDMRTHTKHNIQEHLLRTSNKISQVSAKYVALAESLQTPAQSKQHGQAEGKVAGLKRQILNVQEANSSIEKSVHTFRQEVVSLRKELDKSNAAFAAELRQKDNEIQHLRELEAALLDELAAVPFLQVPNRTPPVTFVLDNFEERRAHNEDWISPPFYSHEGGYKICLTISPNGHGDGLGTHVSIFIHFMPGEYDEGLQWPFAGRIAIILENQQNFLTNYVLQTHQKTKGNYRYDVCLDSLNSLDRRLRVVDQPYGSGWGCPKFISHEVLGPFLASDTLKITVPPVLFLPL